ncbi:hypothetical protein COV20_05480 [Candidatus Woesearchaeota archaeon CG10_big_fil_rev_8_21_14_0_10_45_16]|nr:MAG: hypothetical protein COV20_05480 [Candidatus Woesearchaeota archaeon CG10_big_fil_rev_8_21_14_0_10_45_16]
MELLQKLGEYVGRVSNIDINKYQVAAGLVGALAISPAYAQAPTATTPDIVIIEENGSANEDAPAPTTEGLVKLLEGVKTDKDPKPKPKARAYVAPKASPRCNEYMTTPEATKKFKDYDDAKAVCYPLEENQKASLNRRLRTDDGNFAVQVTIDGQKYNAIDYRPTIWPEQAVCPGNLYCTVYTSQRPVDEVKATTTETYNSGQTTIINPVVYQEPNPDFSIIDINGGIIRAGDELVFVDQTSTDRTASIASREWIFEDGSSANTKNTSHRFNSPGEYTVNLVVEDNLNGNQASATKQFVVFPALPKSENPDAQVDDTFDVSLDSIIGSHRVPFGKDLVGGVTASGRYVAGSSSATNVGAELSVGALFVPEESNVSRTPGQEEFVASRFSEGDGLQRDHIDWQRDTNAYVVPEVNLQLLLENPLSPNWKLGHQVGINARYLSRGVETGELIEETNIINGTPSAREGPQELGEEPENIHTSRVQAFQWGFDVGTGIFFDARKKELNLEAGLEAVLHASPRVERFDLPREIGFDINAEVAVPIHLGSDLYLVPSFETGPEFAEDGNSWYWQLGLGARFNIPQGEDNQ